jgi:major vault protein
MEDFERRRMEVRDRDLIIAQAQYAFVLDKTKGIIGVCVGPFKTSLAGTDQPVRYDDEKREFVDCDIAQAIKQFPLARDGSYLVLENPAKDDRYPKQGANGMEELDYGRKVNIRGPVTFPLWAGQIAKVIPGHNLKSNEYLLVRVYNEEEAIKNWTEAVIKPQSGVVSTEEKGDKEEKEKKEDNGEKKEHPKKDDDIQKEKLDLTTGKQLIIKGTEVSFYIPPTGIEVLPEIGISKDTGASKDADGNFVRRAVTLERLEYCILLDEDGNKRYVKGPAVVFPEPTETFIVENTSKKFRAIELNEISGIYIKTIADYKDEDGKEHKVGDELFITGKERMIYYPREEHAIVKYGDQEKHFAVAIPVGEARYVLNRLSGEIALKKGPCVFLADPRNEVIVRRVLDPKTVAIWFPGNEEAIEYNRRLMDLTRSKRAEEFVTERDAFRGLSGLSGSLKTSYGAEIDHMIMTATPQEKFAGDVMERKTSFTPPRTITLDTKYSGAVSIDIWTGYAVLVIGKGESEGTAKAVRRVVVGPKTVLLEYDESLGIMELSTGKPKTDNMLMKTAYLRVTNNKVSDIITVETKDLVKVEIRLSYLVNFTGEPEKWFDAENYVKLLTQHLRSVISNVVKKKGIEEFYDNSTDIIRNTVLGISDGTSERPGHLFKENGMHIYDVEVLGVKITDDSIAASLVKAQRDVVSQTLTLAAKRRELDTTKEIETIAQYIASLKSTTKIEEFKLQIKETEERLNVNIKKLEADLEERKKDAEVNKARLVQQKDIADQDVEIAAKKQRLQIEKIKEETEEVVAILKAIQPELIATMKAVGNQELAKVLAQNLPKAAGSFGLLTNKGGMNALINMVKGTPLEEGLTTLLGAEQDKTINRDETTKK